MKLENLANISEIFSSIAIVITLIVLVFEVNGNTAAIQRQVDNDRASRLTDIYDSPYLPSIFAKINEVDSDSINPMIYVLREQYELTFEEAGRLNQYMSQYWRGYEADFLSAQPGSEDRDAQMIRILNSPLDAIFWETSKDKYNQAFVEHVNGLLQISSG